VRWLPRTRTFQGSWRIRIEAPKIECSFRGINCVLVDQLNKIFLLFDPEV
jgi:hypothetical protein